MAPNTEGSWGPNRILALPRQTVRDVLGHTMSDERDLFVIHAVLMHTNKVLLFSGLTESLNYPAVAFVYDIATRNLHPRPFPPDTDLFCCHYVQLSDGRILVVGGSQQDRVDSPTTATYRGSRGGTYVAIFDPVSGPHGDWVVPLPGTPRLTEGRWYPTAVHLGDGRVLVFSGRLPLGVAATQPPQGPMGRPWPIARSVEQLAPPNYTSTTVAGAGTPMLPIYPGLHLLPDARIVYTHTNWGQEVNEPPTMALTVGGTAAAPTGAWNDFGAAAAAQPSHPRREEGMSVLLPLRPPNYDARILVAGGSQAVNSGGVGIYMGGGGNAGFDRPADATDATSVEIMTVPAGGPPTWTNGSLLRPRINGHCVLLPDGRVLILGGHNAFKWRASANAVGVTVTTTTPSLEVELFTPPAGAAASPLPATTLGAAMEGPRMYHAVALLLPDGRVMVAGGAEPNHHEPAMGHPYPADWPSGRRYPPGPFPAARLNGNATMAHNRKTHQIYSPPYFFNGARPTIASVRRGGVDITQIEYGQQFVITSPQAAQIAAGTVVMMRPGAPTHHTDSEQRYVELEKTVSGNEITATVPPVARASVLPPGWYMLWIVTGGATPLPCTQASWLKVAHPPPAPPPPPPPPPGP